MARGSLDLSHNSFAKLTIGSGSSKAPTPYSFQVHIPSPDIKAVSSGRTAHDIFIMCFAFIRQIEAVASIQTAPDAALTDDNFRGSLLRFVLCSEGELDFREWTETIAELLG